MTHVSESHIKCASCGYNLTGVTIGSVCPECGTSVDASILARRDGDRTCGTATAAMVLGIVSLAACMPLGIVALLVGYRARKEMALGGFTRSSHTMAKAGIIMGWITAAIMMAYVLFIVLAFALSA